MNKKAYIILGIIAGAAVSLTLLGRYQRKSFRATLEQMREDFLKFDKEDEIEPEE